MRVAITHTRHSFVGGVEKYIYSLVERLLASGHEVHYFCHFWEKNADPRIHFHKVPYLFKPVRFLKILAFDILSERMVIREGPFDIVHGFTKTSRQDIYTDGSGTRRAYQKYSLTAFENPVRRALRRFSLYEWAVRWAERRRYTRGNFKKIVTMSKLVADQIHEEYGLNEEEVEVLYNGLDLEQFCPENVALHRTDVRRESEVPEDARVLLFVGKDYLRKNLETFLRVIARIPEAWGLVLGQERKARFETFREMARELGVESRVRFLGERRQVNRYFAASDVLVFPTVFDAFGNVTLEAMATGIPAIVSARAGSAEVVVEGETGSVIADPHDEKGFAEATLAFLDPTRREAVAQRSRAEAERYSWDCHFERMMAIYDEVAAAKRGRSWPTRPGQHHAHRATS